MLRGEQANNPVSMADVAAFLQTHTVPTDDQSRLVFYTNDAGLRPVMGLYVARLNGRKALVFDTSKGETHGQ